MAKNLLALADDLAGIVVNMRDITERKQLMAQLETLSETDLLTGVFNRRGFMKFAAREFERARRAGRKLAVVMLDIDHFKAVNDRYGHAAGDLVLAMIAEEGAPHRCGASISSPVSAARSSRSSWWTVMSMPRTAC